MDLTEDAIQALALLGADAQQRRVVQLPDGSYVLTAHDGTESSVLTQATKDSHGLMLAKPVGIKESVTIETADSLVDYLLRYKTAGTMLFATISANKIVAVLDYHDKPEAPDHGRHTATLKLPFSEEWKLWTDINGKWQDQLDFGRFLKENALDVEVPDAATLIETAMDIQAVRKVDFTKAVRLNSENAEAFEYIETTEATTRKGTLKIPEEFQLNIPVYFGDKPGAVMAALRWRLVETTLQLGIALQRAERIRQACFKIIADDIAIRAGVPVLYGARNASS